MRIILALTLILFSVSVLAKPPSFMYKHIELALHQGDEGVYFVINGEGELLVREYRVLHVSPQRFLPHEMLASFCAVRASDELPSSITALKSIEYDTIKTHVGPGYVPILVDAIFDEFMFLGYYEDASSLEGEFERYLIAMVISEFRASGCGLRADSIEHFIDELEQEVSK